MARNDSQGETEMTALRVDKWLWAARFFKTRGLATSALDGGKVQVNGQRVKPSRAVRVGDAVQVRRGHDVMTVVVAGLSERRGPATVAQQLYEETEASQQARAEAAAQRRVLRESADLISPAQRPSKKDRREIRRLTGKE